MKRLFAIAAMCGFCLLTTGTNAQDTKTKMSKQAKKEQRELIRKQNAALTSLAIDSSAFVLEADQLRSKRGTTINVPSSLNFVAVNGKNGFVQIGSNAAVGTNGVGGVSVDTQVTKITVEKNAKTGAYSIQLNCMSTAGIFDISISSSDDGQMATATIGGNWGGKLTYIGRLVPLPLSTVYKGTPRY
ncbi:MAG: DUF4251 domain-containing protein [Mangrovibacterium sp.]